MPTTGPDGVESGFQTTEFWTSLVVSLVGLLVTVGIIKPPAPALINEIAGLVALVAPQIAYAISRGLRKRGLAAPVAAAVAPPANAIPPEPAPTPVAPPAPPTVPTAPGTTLQP